MGQIGAVVFEAWLHQSNMLVKTPQASDVARHRRRAAEAEAEAAEIAAEREDDGWRGVAGSERSVAAAAEEEPAVSDIRTASSQRQRQPSRGPSVPGAWAAAGCGCGDTSCDIEFSHQHLEYSTDKDPLEYAATDGRKMPLRPSDLDTIASILEDGANV